MKLGENALAMTLADRRLSANPIENDAMTGPWSLEVFARVTAGTGDHDRSIAALRSYFQFRTAAGFPCPTYTSATETRPGCLIPCVTIRVSKNCARKSSRDVASRSSQLSLFIYTENTNIASVLSNFFAANASASASVDVLSCGESRVCSGGPTAGLVVAHQ